MRTDSEFTEFVRARSAALLRTAYLLTGDRGLAEDLLQTALTKAYLAWGRIHDPGAVEAYVRKILVNTATSWWRRKSWRRERPSGAIPGEFGLPEGIAQSRADEIDERSRIWAHVGELSAGQRAVIVLRYYEDLTEAETAELLGCSVGTVKQQAHRALKRLRGMVGDAPPAALVLQSDGVREATP